MAKIFASIALFIIQIKYENVRFLSVYFFTFIFCFLFLFCFGLVTEISIKSKNTAFRCWPSFFPSLLERSHIRIYISLFTSASEKYTSWNYSHMNIMQYEQKNHGVWSGVRRRMYAWKRKVSWISMNAKIISFSSSIPLYYSTNVSCAVLMVGMEKKNSHIHITLVVYHP